MIRVVVTHWPCACENTVIASEFGLICCFLSLVIRHLLWEQRTFCTPPVVHSPVDSYVRCHHSYNHSSCSISLWWSDNATMILFVMQSDCQTAFFFLPLVIVNGPFSLEVQENRQLYFSLPQDWGNKTCVLVPVDKKNILKFQDGGFVERCCCWNGHLWTGEHYWCLDLCDLWVTVGKWCAINLTVLSYDVQSSPSASFRLGHSALGILSKNLARDQRDARTLFPVPKICLVAYLEVLCCRLVPGQQHWLLNPDATCCPVTLSSICIFLSSSRQIPPGIRLFCTIIWGMER